jgi:hypothetical protein
MFLLVGVALAIQATQGGPPAAHKNSADTTIEVRDTTKAVVHRDGGHVAHRLPVTPQALATAFADSQARTLLLTARAARLRQDSALVSYDVKAYQRISAGMSLSDLGRDHLLYRQESVSRVRWRRGTGAWVDMLGARAAATGVTVNDGEGTNGPPAPVPYYPGYEELWIGGGLAKANVDESEMVNPLANGAEAYYTYATGQSVGFTLPGGKHIRIRELKVRPRTPRWNVVIGSLWFDAESGELVRAAYRLAVPLDIWELAKADTSDGDDDAPPGWLTGLASPLTASLSSVTVEYGLYDGRFWLPRLRAADGRVRAVFMRMPLRMEQSFDYTSVNALDTLPDIVVAASDSMRDPSDSAHKATSAVRDSIYKARRLANRTSRKAQCDTASTWVRTTTRYDNAISVATRVPCDTLALSRSAELPASLYDSQEELFGASDLEELRTRALALGAQAPFGSGLGVIPPTVQWGLSMTRYNRIEGLSTGVSVGQELGGGYNADVTARLGTADLEPNAELRLTRTNLSRSIHVEAYNHLVSASDWGNPLSFGSSLSALLWGRDEGFYYRATGAELGGGRDVPFGGARITWRAFAEQQRTAAVNTTFSFASREFQPNLTAARGWYTGAGVLAERSFGQDPAHLRLLAQARLEAATGDSTYGRGSLDLTLSRGIGAFAAAITGSGGTSVGGVPAQRLWYLGGAQTVRGQSADLAQSGNAYWFTRAELGLGARGAVRPSVFGDLGWVGDRADFRNVGRPLSGVGAGLSFMDGLFRMDLARGIYPRKQWRFDTYVEARF